jgi:hypothetical protein
MPAYIDLRLREAIQMRYPVDHPSRCCALVAFSVFALCAHANAQPMITHWYHAEAWRFPDPPQDWTDPSSLPTDPDSIEYNESVYSDSTSNPVDLSVGGDTPRSGPAGTSRHEIRVKANSDATHLRAAFETRLSNFQASNLRPGYYLDGDGNVQVDFGDWSGQTFVATFIDELFTLSGPSSGMSNLTYVLHLSGSNTSNVAVSGTGFIEPVTGGVISAYGAELYGPYLELPKNSAIAQTATLTVQLNLNAPTFTRLAMNLHNDLIGFNSNLTDEEAATTFLDGEILWNYETTASIEKLIVELPAGANPLDYTLMAQSGTNYNVEFRVVPEPSAIALLLVAIMPMAFRKRAAA